MKQLSKLALISLTLCALPALGGSKVEQAKEVGKTAGLITAFLGSLYLTYEAFPVTVEQIDRSFNKRTLDNEARILIPLELAVTSGAIYGIYYFGKKSLQRLSVLDKPVADQPEEDQPETDLN